MNVTEIEVREPNKVKEGEIDESKRRACPRCGIEAKIVYECNRCEITDYECPKCGFYWVAIHDSIREMVRDLLGLSEESADLLRNDIDKHLNLMSRGNSEKKEELTFVVREVLEVIEGWTEFI